VRGQPSRSRRRPAQVLGAAFGLALAFTAVMGFAHTKPGKPLLAWMGMASGGKAKGGACPFGYDVPASPAQHDQNLRAFASKHPSDLVAAARPALAFELGHDTRADVERWAATYGVACRKPRTGPDLDCSDVPDAALPLSARGAPVASAWFVFDAHDALSSLTVVRSSHGAEETSATFQRVSADLTQKAGPSSKATGEPTAAYLSTGLLYQASVEYQFHNYYAELRATNMREGFALTESYRRLAA
jgi:hypothetical protein